MEDPNILLVILDSVRARNCGFLGHDNETTPFLSEFAAESVVFEQAHAPSIHSVASHASIFSGYHVSEHGISDHADRLKPEASVWHKLAENQGYSTGIFTPNVVVTQSSNLSDSFETVYGPSNVTGSRLFNDALSPSDINGDTNNREYVKRAQEHEKTIKSLINGFYHALSSSAGEHDPRLGRAEVYIDEFLAWVGKQDGSWAGCLNLMDAHYPYLPKSEHDKWAGDPIALLHEEVLNRPMSEQFLKERPIGQLRSFESLYDGCIHQLDAALERLVTRLTEQDILEDTLLVITSDHGEGFGERSTISPPVRLIDHSWGIDEVLTHVPLIVNTPSPHGESGKRIDRIASLTRFPAVVQAAVQGNEAVTEFVPEDDRVLSSTFRIKPPGDELPLNASERSLHFGPWRAVYEDTGSDVVKYAKRGNDEVTVKIQSPQTSFRIKHSSEGVVEEEFDKLYNKNVKINGASEQEIPDDVEASLHDLGYLR